MAVLKELIKRTIIFILVLHSLGLYFIFYKYSDIISPSSTSLSIEQRTLLTDQYTQKIDEDDEIPTKDAHKYGYSDTKEINQIIENSNNEKKKGNFHEAVKILDEGIKKYPESDLLHTYKGGCFFDQQNWGQAEIWYKKAHELNPKSVWHLNNVAVVLSSQNKHVEAIKYQKKAYRLEPTTSRLMNLYWAMANINDYSMYDVYFFKLMDESRAIIAKGEFPPVDPFVALHYPFSLKELYAICNSRAMNIKNDVERDFPGVKPYTYQPIKNRRIRVGYVSYDLRGHAVGIQFQDVFKYHNKSEFEVFGLNVCVSSKINYKSDHLYQQMKRDSEHMIDLEDANTKAAADKINELGLDIIVDIGLYTAGNRMDIFVLKPAPIQAAGVGLATTTGAPWIDYLIADNFVTPPETAPYYAEKLLLMPHSYHPFSHRNYYPKNPPVVPRENLGLPNDKFLYCNHAGATRLEPKTIGYWADIIKRVNNSALVLKRFDDRTENVVREFRKRGLYYSEDHKDPKNQIYFMWGAGKDDHIAGKSNCNVFLDVHYYNGHSTTGDMLWAGVPMITFPDVSIASRAAGSFALSAGFPEMIVTSWEEYVDRAAQLGIDRDRYEGYRKRIESSRFSNHLFDMVAYVKALEMGYKEMVNIYNSGEGPKHIVVNELV